MSTATVASSAQEYYLALRGAGTPHEEAVQKTAHAFGRRPAEVKERLARARRDFDVQQGTEPEPPAEPELPVREPDVFEQRVAELAREVAGLEGNRATLAFDALTDPKAKPKLAKVEAELAATRNEIEQTELARAESARRDREEQQQAAQQAVEDALRRAAEIGADRLRSAEHVDAAARAFGEALAEHQAVAHLQFQALGEAGRDIRWDQVLPRDEALRGALISALSSTSSPAGWLDRPSHSELVRAAPLAATDVRPIEPISPDSAHPKGK